MAQLQGLGQTESRLVVRSTRPSASFETKFRNAAVGCPVWQHWTLERWVAHAVDTTWIVTACLSERCLGTAKEVCPVAIEAITFSRLSLLATSSSTQLRFAIWEPTRPNTAISPPTPIRSGCKLEADSAERRCCGSDIVALGAVGEMALTKV